MNILKSFVLVFFIFSQFLYARSIEDIKNSGEIIIAVYENFPPYSFVENGEAKGIDIEIGKKLAQSLKVKPKWQFTGSDENLDDDLRNLLWKGNLIHKNKADMMFRVPYDYNFIREKDVSTGELSHELVVMKSPYHAEKWVILTRKSAIEKINTLGVFAYHKIGVELDTLPDTHLSLVNRGQLQKNIKHYFHLEEAITAFKNEEIDAIAGLKSQLEYLLDFNNNKDKYYMSEEIIGAKSIWDIGVAVMSNYRALSYHIDGEIKKLYRDKTIEKIFAEYNVNYLKPISKSK